MIEFLQAPWIRVADQLPDDGLRTTEPIGAGFSVQVLGYSPEFGGCIDIFAWWPATRKWTVCMISVDGVADVESIPTHWMPLPAAPDVVEGLVGVQRAQAEQSIDHGLQLITTDLGPA